MGQINNPYNYYFEEPIKKYPPSETMPNQGLSIKEMIKRLQNGQQIIANQNYQYPDNEEDMQIRIKDLTDLDDMKKQISATAEKVKRLSNGKTNNNPSGEA